MSIDSLLFGLDVKNVIESKNSVEDDSIKGVGGKFIEIPSPSFNKRDDEKLVGIDSNCRIVFGKERTTHKFSGFGGRGHTHCSSIDMVCGALGRFSTDYVLDTETEENLSLRSGDDKIKKMNVDPHPHLDSARIKISQKSTPDYDYGLSGDTMPRTQARSFVINHADGVRIISRDAGIKLVTGVGNRNSLGVKMSKLAPKGIELIAGNKGSELQPLVKGINLVKAINLIVSCMEDLVGVMENSWQSQRIYNGLIAFHTHLDGVPLPAPLDQLFPIVSQTYPDWSVGTGGIKRALDHLFVEAFPAFTLRGKLKTIDQNYLQKGSRYYINSILNKTN